ncbi:putative Nucleotide-binding, alpha-beta plait, RNA recognition motif domain protein, partial [Trachipleistophora hominis]
MLAFTKMFRTLQNELLYNNRTVYIKFIKHNYRIFISGLKKTLTKELVIDYLSDKGYGVTDVLVPVGGDVKNRGYCFVQFDGESGVKRFKDEYRKYKGFFGTASRIEYAKRDEHD